MKTILHVSDGWEPLNGAANIARLIAGEQSAAGHDVGFRRWASPRSLRRADEVWVHCGWKPCLWWAVLWGRHVAWVPEACYDPVRLKHHGWKKKLAGPFERFFLRRCERIVATCPAEAEWVRTYEPSVRAVEVTDIRRFFSLESRENALPSSPKGKAGPLHVLYLGRRHPLKGVEYLEKAVAACGAAIELRLVSTAQGEEKERVWQWADALCLPTLSDNLGLVVAEALERGKRVITTDGAPAWGDGVCADRLTYLRGFRDGTDDERVRLLTDALKNLCHGIPSNMTPTEKRK